EKVNPSEILCLPSEMGWSDVGTWDALSRFPEAGASSQQIVLEEAKNVFFAGPQEKVFAAAGVENLIVVDTSDALVITQRGKSHLIKKVVEKLQERQHPVVTQQKIEERPWGFFEVIKEAEHFKSKLIQLEPNQQLSYQSHQHREEHWILVKGHGLFTLDDQVRNVQKGDYLHIPKGAKHRIRNTGTERLEFIEVQLGSSFAESDITRYLDDYKRIENTGASS
ncbi:MAG: cupin domain-containing protein, partial [Bdellovibrio sp.]